MRFSAAIAIATACALIAPAAAAGSGTERNTTAADASDAAKARAEKFLEKGIEAYRDHRYKDAIESFLEAESSYPSPTLSYNTARAYEKLGDTPGALRFYRAYLRQAPDAPDRKRVQRRIEKFEKLLHKKGLQQLTVLSDPDGATVIVDGRPVGVTPWTGEIFPGLHRLRLRREGYLDKEQDFKLPDLSAIDLNVKLEPAPAETPRAPVAPPPGPPREEQVHHGVRLPTWIAFGVGAAALGTAAVFEGLRRSSENSVKSESTQVARASAYDQMKSRQTTARVLAVAGGATLVVGGVLLYVDLSTSRSETAARLGLGCGSDGCDASVRGRW